MKTDPIVEEIRNIKESRAAKFGYDVRAMAEDLKKREKQGGRKVVSLCRERKTG